DGDDSIQVCKIVPSRFADSDQKVTSSLDLCDVIRRAANLGATYPEIVAILQAAHRQQNLPGPLVVDAVPGARPDYLEAAILGKDRTAKKDASPKKDGAVKPAKFDDGSDKPSRPGLLNRLFRRFSSQ